LAFGDDCGDLPALDAFRAPDGYSYFPNWNTWLNRSTGFGAAGSARLLFAPPTVRMFAGRQGRRAGAVRSSLPLVPLFADWTHGRTIRAAIAARPDSGRPGPDARLTLGIIAAASAGPDVLDLCRDTLGLAAAAVVLLDTADATAAAGLEAQLRAAGAAARVIAHPLGGDFAGQRNRIQRAAPTAWVLQLDCDERLNSGAKRDLSGLIDDAEREGWDAVAFTRRNLVDGVVSALFPDVQYRLLRRTVRFVRPVHEYPRLGRHQRSFVNLGAGIVHLLSGDRLAHRETLYDAIEGGAGRPHDTALLRLPLEPGVVLPA
jgi:hypothetical protein